MTSTDTNSSVTGPVSPELRRIGVIGTTGSGKTSVARQLSQVLGVPNVELDALNWGPTWTPAPTEVFRQRVAVAIEGERWVVDGNYSKARDLVWPKATTLVWLDYALRVIMWRLFWRALRRIISREELWSRNRERFASQFLSRDSLFVWALKSYWRRRLEYPALFSRAEYTHLSVVRLRSPNETRGWLAEVTRTLRQEMHR